MAFVGDMFSPSKGAGFQAQGTPLIDSVNQQQLGQAANQVNSGIDQQQAFLNALQAQNGIQNQSDIFAQQQAFSNQLQNQANGQGPNPALAQLANTTAQNVQNQSAMMGSQRGASANPALLARLAAQQGANTQQQAAGQGAVLSAQQQLAAQQMLQNQQNMMGSMATQQVGQQSGALSNYNQFAQGNQSALLNAAAQRNAANVGMQQNINNSMGTIANTNAQGQWQTLGGITGGMGTALGMIPGLSRGGMVHHYAGGGMAEPQSFAVSMPAQSNASADISSGGSPSVTSFDSGVEHTFDNTFKKKKDKGPQAPAGKGGEGTGSSSGSDVAKPSPLGMGQSMGGTQLRDLVPAEKMYDEGGEVTPQPIQQTPLQVSQPTQPDQPQSFVTQFMNESNASAPVTGGGAPSTSSFDSGMEHAFSKSGGSSGGGGMASMLPMLAMAAKDGGKVPGHAQVDGNSLKNDKVPAMLSPGEVVVPRSITQGDNAPEKAAQFVAAVLAKESRKKAK